MTGLIDTHAHLDEFSTEDLASVLTAAADAGVNRIVNIGGSEDANAAVLKQAQTHPDSLRCAVGYDRYLAGKNPSLELLRAQAEQSPVVAIGETGLDYHYEKENAVAQKALFEEMLNMAWDFLLPVVVHSREADEDTLERLARHAQRWSGEKGRLGVLHCFTGGKAFARRLVEMGYMISFSGIVTFRNAEALREVVAVVPDEALLVETDTPYLAPEPHRGKKNQPAYVTEVVARIAEIRHCPTDEIVAITTRNAQKLFSWS